MTIVRNSWSGHKALSAKMPESSRGRAPHSYQPFGTGERACIGRQFALHEAVLLLARLLHRQRTGVGLPTVAGVEIDVAFGEPWTLSTQRYQRSGALYRLLDCHYAVH